MRKYKNLGRYNGSIDEEEEIEYDQNKCIFQPKMSEYLSDGILGAMDLKTLTNFGVTNETVLDAFKLFYYKDKEVAVSPQKYWLHNFLNKCDNHILNMVTSGNPGFSYIAANAVIDTLAEFMRKENPDCDQMNKDIKDGNSNDQLDKLNKYAKKAFNRAKKAIQNTQDTANDFGCSKDFGKDLESAQILSDSKLLNSISINGEELAKFVKHVINKAVSYNTGKKYMIEESLFDADDIDDIANLESFVHIALLQDLSVIENKYSMNFDIFIDDSGSMGCNYNLGGKRIELRTLARMIGFKMHAMKMVKDIWLFSSRDELFKIDPSELFNTRIDGGTDISQCIIEANKSDRPCLIITDGNDHLEESIPYNDKVYLLVLETYSFSDTWKRYAENKQILFYDSHSGFEQGVYSSKSGGIYPESQAR